MTAKTQYLIASILFLLAALPLHAQWSVDVETGLIFPGYNEVRIPNEGGSTFDFNRDFDIEGPVIPLRVRVGYTFAEKNHILGLYAPLTARYEGMAPCGGIAFQGAFFEQGTPLDGRYQFNSYRLTYRRDLLRSEAWVLGLGFTAKIRDASVQLTSAAADAQKDDVGFVPLLHIHASYRTGSWLLYLDGDGLAGGPGRAFDFFAGAAFSLGETVMVKAGYRILEGGADVPEVYNFTLLNFASVGVIWQPRAGQSAVFLR